MTFSIPRRARQTSRLCALEGQRKYLCLDPKGFDDKAIVALSGAHTVGSAAHTFGEAAGSSVSKHLGRD